MPYNRNQFVLNFCIDPDPYKNLIKTNYDCEA